MAGADLLWEKSTAGWLWLVTGAGLVWEKAEQSDKQEASKCPGHYWRIGSHHHLIVHALVIYYNVWHIGLSKDMNWLND